VVSPPSPEALPASAGGASVALENVTFRYPSRPQHPTLIDFSLVVAPGETVALVGPSGAGKSTVFQLILRFYDVESGAVRIDGARVGRVALDALRGRIGIVPQDSVIFSADAMENIRYGRPQATDAEVIAAATAAYAHDFITALPEGYKTFLGERGVRLSGGQKQRIAIARALLADPRVLILDEATSNLDSESEVLIQRSLSTLMKGRTCFVIAHRLSTIRHADLIVVMENGRIIETGTHDQLLAQEGRYWEMLRVQLHHGELDAKPQPQPSASEFL
jgi:ATP-binding cassette subfamily B protein